MSSPERIPILDREHVLLEAEVGFEQLLGDVGFIDWPGVREVVAASWEWADDVTRGSRGPTLGTALGVAVYRIVYRILLAARYKADRDALRDSLNEFVLQFVDEGGTPEQMGELGTLSEDSEIDLGGRR